MNCRLTLVLAMTLLAVSGGVQGSPQSDRERNMMYSNRCWAKAGLGIVSGNLYIDLKGARNRLLVDDGEWIGKSRQTRQVVFVQDDKVLSSDDLPRQFTLGKSVIVSFEGDVVRFFIPEQWFGGYYERFAK
jgi:hypothetical protein